MGKKGGSKEDGNIQTFLRIRPSKKPSGYFKIAELESKSLTFALPDNYNSGDGRGDYINNTKLRHDFHFNDIIPDEAKQEEVFKKVGMAAVQNALDGFNSTIFAYGQTGSGKTFTITGGPERYADRGIIPRSISMIFNEFRKRTNVQCKAFISYLEIYNDTGYDLLDPSHETKALEDLPKVSILEDEHGNFHLKNLSMNPAESEEDALNLLFMGDTNRAIAETPMNMASSRSHCIFTVAMEVRENGSDKIRRSKLHLVDLAGSERIGKTDSQGTTRTEAKYINSSLFFLEMVIVALYEKSTKGRTHIPYRNSMMTSVLRDSLGGNCKTIMIATINPEMEHTDESLSTCRFAQRVSLIKNRAMINEDLDPSMVIRRLKQEILTLREEIAFLKGDAGEGDILTPGEIEKLKLQCRDYVVDPDPRGLLNIGSMTLTKIKDTFAILKNLALEYKATSGGNNTKMITNEDNNSNNNNNSQDVDLMRQVKDLKSCLLQRDNEIAILVNMVKKGKTEAHVANAVGSRDGSRSRRENDMMMDNNNSVSIQPSAMGHYDYQPSSSRDSINNNNNNNNSRENREQEEMIKESDNISKKSSSSSSSLIQSTEQREKMREQKIIERHLFGVAPPSDQTESKALMEDPQIAFEYFRERCGLSPAIEENKEILRQKYAEAKSLGERANSSRSTINYLKNSIESLRREKALSSVSASSEDKDNDVESEQEATHRRAIEQEKGVYKESFERLRVLKPEIEHLRKILEKGRTNLQSQFDQWYSALSNRDGKILNNGNKSNTKANLSASSNTSSINGYEVSTGSSSAGVSLGDTNNSDMNSRKGLAWGTPPRNNQRSNQSIHAENKADSSHSSSNSISSSTANRAESKNEVNEDIMAFYQAKEELLKRRANR